jgi:hypothetical protein
MLPKNSSDDYFQCLSDCFSTEKSALHLQPLAPTDCVPGLLRWQINAKHCIAEGINHNFSFDIKYIDAARAKIFLRARVR